MRHLRFRAILAALVLAVPGLLPAVGCSSSTSATPPSGDGGPGKADATTDGGTTTTTVSGLVVDTSGNPLPGVTLTVGSATGTTAADGTISLVIAAATPQVFAFRKAGFVGRTLEYGVTPGQQIPLYVEMLPATPAQPLDATAGGTVTGPRGSSLTIPPNALVDATGALVAGTVQVSLTPIDPTIPAEFAAYPGGLEAKNSAGQYGYLWSHGVLEIQVTQGASTLNLKPGMTATALIPAPTSQANAPSSTSSWSLDETAGVWNQEAATATLDASTHLYTLSLPHLSAWNCDDFQAPGCIYGQLVDKAQHPIPSASIVALTTDNLSSGLTYSIQDGHFCLSMGVDQSGTTFHVFPKPLTQPTAYYPVFIGALPNHEVTESVYMCNDPTQCAQLGNVVVDTSMSPDGGPVSGGDGGAGEGGTTMPGAGPACTLGVDAGTGGTASDAGASMETPLTGCLAGLNAVLECFAPGGGCTTTPTSTTSSTNKWTNGSKAVWTYTGSLASGVLYSPTGSVCGQIASSPGGGATISDELGNAWLFGLGDAGGDAGQVVTCELAGGATPTQVTISGSDSNTALVCSGNFGLGGAGGCQIVNPVGAPCPNGPSDCTSQASDCCMGKAGPLCLPASACPAYVAQGCGSSADCTTAGDSCCNIVGAPFPVCLPQSCGNFDGGSTVNIDSGSPGTDSGTTCTPVTCSVQLSNAVTEAFPCSVSVTYASTVGTAISITSSSSSASFSDVASIVLPGQPTATTYTGSATNVANTTMQQSFDGGIPDGGTTATVVAKGWQEQFSADAAAASDIGSFSLQVTSVGPVTALPGATLYTCMHGTYTATLVSVQQPEAGAPVQMTVTF